jgi:hypothetical protein
MQGFVEGIGQLQRLAHPPLGSRIGQRQVQPHKARWAGRGGSGEPVQGCIAFNLSWRLARLEQIPPDQSGLVGSIGKIGGIHQ